ncbi:MAG TPA: translation initiation factor IF-2 [Candidatus Saccharimonadales bacterium]|nr:translation initiation factor IF-2 [Candidatus Saccharimonadales bacterium]
MAQKIVVISATITVGELAAQLDIPVTRLIGELFKNGIAATVNQKIDFDTAQIIVDELGLEDIELQEKDETVPEAIESRKERTLSDKAVTRPPIVAVMGHVDHGKTSLLDAILDTKVASGESGGITQHISAYQATHKDRVVTFLDTPGHEAFSALRQHGAALTDVALIVVAADDGVKPQTIEAIKFARQANAHIVVAINKIDKPGADVNRVKQELSEQQLMPEEWGGDTVMVEVSAKTKENIDKLLDMVLLVADIDELKAEVDVPAEGLVIESHMELGRGPVASLLVEHGHLSPGQYVVAGKVYGKIRTLGDYRGDAIKDAGPSTPVVITGFKEMPGFGDHFSAVKSEKDAKFQAETAQRAGSGNSANMNVTSAQLLQMISKKAEVSFLNVVLKADVQGSLTSLVDSLQMVNTKEVEVRVIGSGVGNISENDVRLASGSEAVIYGFNIEVSSNIKRLAAREGVSIRVFKVIYELLDDVKEVMTALLAPKVVETEVGSLIVRGVFRSTKDTIICGGEVTKGKAEPGVLGRVLRDKEQIAEVDVVSVQRQMQEAKEVFEGEMCGLQLKTHGKLLIQEGDRIEFFKREMQTRTL